MKKLIALTATTLTLLTAACSGGADNRYGTLSPDTLKVGVTSDAKPYAYSENGEIKGFDVEIATAVAERMDMEIEFVAQEFSTLLPAVSNRQLDMVAASVSNTEERRQNVDFSDPYFVGYITVLAKAGSGITDDPATLSGKRLGLVQGTIQDDYAQQNFEGVEIVRFPDNNSAISAVNSGTVDAHFLDYPVAQDYAESSDGTLEITVNVEMDEFPVGFPIAKGQDELKEGLNSAIQEVIEDGTWLETKNEYFPDQPVPAMFEAAQ